MDMQDWMDASGWRDGDSCGKSRASVGDFALIPAELGRALDEKMSSQLQHMYEYVGGFVPLPRKHECVEAGENAHVYTHEMQKHAVDCMRLYVRDVDWENIRSDFVAWCTRHEMQFHDLPVKLFKQCKPMHMIFVWLSE